jgi:hypothetical protein
MFVSKILSMESQCEENLEAKTCGNSIIYSKRVVLRVQSQDFQVENKKNAGGKLEIHRPELVSRIQLSYYSSNYCSTISNRAVFRARF